MIGRRALPAFSKSQRYGSGFQGSPVEPRIRSELRSWAWTCSGPCGMSARTAVGDSPMMVTLWRSTIDQSRSGFGRSEEHTSELQSHSELVCRLLLEKKNRVQL